MTFPVAPIPRLARMVDEALPGVAPEVRRAVAMRATDAATAVVGIRLQVRWVDWPMPTERQVVRAVVEGALADLAKGRLERVVGPERREPCACCGEDALLVESQGLRCCEECASRMNPRREEPTPEPYADGWLDGVGSAESTFQ